ncbi:hypothetical protein [Kutzneria chonburiensis]|uniref:Secreted protein n=1 Tax=Kutzneria chonburiensis TaxID=1483604 RepID=A0ABV6N2X8_9PSEU|nr:hypothetical protein [Kutzneria chonburiensis]
MSVTAVVLIGFLVLTVAGLSLALFFLMRHASRRVDRILSEELGHRGAHERYDEELRAWREAPRD